MKKYIKTALRPLVCTRVGLKIVSALNNLTKTPPIKNRSLGAPLYNKVIEGMQVLHGPFKGLKYPGLKSVCSTIYPKLLGSYESELGPLIESLCQKNYSAIVDIGCAEGYYAIGFALRIPSARVYAFDTDDEALALCKKMADLNQTSIKLGGFCDSKTLEKLDLGSKALIISDCEGYEAYLFSKELVRKLSQHDFLIESHDCINIQTTQILREAFADTHTIEEIQSVDDIIKAYTYNYPELASFSLEDKRNFLHEGRPGTMRWLYLQPK
jgi:precorrin-6B methylase 2